MAAIRSVGLSIVGAVGVAGVLKDSRPDLLLWQSINLHALFGLLLCFLVIVLAVVEKGAAWRRQCRAVSVLLYGVFGADLLLRTTAVPAGAILRPPENLRDYFVYGLLAMILCRVLEALSARRPPAPRMNLEQVPAEDAVARQ
jgi:hypothetical protein